MTSNILFIMSDQLRWDHVSAYGRSPVETPNIDRIARRGVRFDAAYVQGPVCGPSRMSYYTGRYVTSHGATWNRVPLSVREKTLGDHLRAAGRVATLAGKTHVMPDTDALDRYGIEIESERGALLREGGFVPIERFDGHSPPDARSGYADYLRGKGYAGSGDPWSEFAVSMQDQRGAVVSGWQMRNLHLPARVRAEDSETAYLTDRALEFLRANNHKPWVLHLSYVKPHWPYVAPAPYHAMYRGKDIGTVIRSRAEFDNQHPVLAAFRQHPECLTFARDEVVAHVRPAYLGLVKELDDHIGRVLDELESLGRMQDTLIVFCSDHGWFGGDHWLDEKELFFESAVRVPFIVHDPSADADATRGTADARFVECVDVVPTILDALDIARPRHWIEGRSLLPLTRGRKVEWRDCVFSEADYSFRPARWALKREPHECRGWMVRTAEWKYIHWQGFGPQLYNLISDPDEFIDYGTDPRYAGICAQMRERLFDWMSGLRLRTTVSDEEVEQRTDGAKRHGILIGNW